MRSADEVESVTFRQAHAGRLFVHLTRSSVLTARRRSRGPPRRGWHASPLEPYGLSEIGCRRGDGSLLPQPQPRHSFVLLPGRLVFWLLLGAGLQPRRFSGPDAPRISTISSVPSIRSSCGAVFPAIDSRPFRRSSMRARRAFLAEVLFTDTTLDLVGGTALGLDGPWRLGA